MENPALDIPKIMFSAFWEVKELFFIMIGIAVLALALRVMLDLASRRSKIKWYLGKKKVQDLQQLTPTQFEEYIAALFQSLGYETKVTGGSGDGGVDVEAVKDGYVHYIQCKKYISSKVPVSAVRDFYGAIADRVDGGKGYFITTNVFTLDAEKFAEDKPIELIDKFKLMEYMQMVDTTVPEVKASVCQKCGSELIKRKGKYGSFLGCSTYPKCDFTQKI